MSTYTVTFRYSDTALTLNQSSFLIFQKLANGGTPTNPAPSTFTPIGYGMYRFDYTAVEEVAFVLDGGPSVPAAERYIRGVLSPMDTRLDSPISTVTAAISNVNNNVQSVAIDIGDIYTEVTTNNTTVNQVNNIVENITQSVTQVVTNIETQNNSLTQIDNSITYITNNVLETIAATATETQNAISAVNTSVINAQASVSTVNNNIQAVNVSLAGVISGAIETQTTDISDRLADLESKLDSQAVIISTLLQFSTGRWKVHTSGPDANRIVYYSDDGVTALAKFDLKDMGGSPTFAAAFERVPVEE